MATNFSSDDDSVVPANISAESTILGAILIENSAFYEVVEAGIEPDDFFLDSHRRIFLRMTELMDSDCTVDVVTLSNELTRNKEMSTIGGAAYLSGLTEGLPRRPVINEYLRIIKDKALARRLMAISSMAITRASDQRELAADLVAESIEKMEASLTNSIRHSVKDISTILLQDIPRFEAEADAPTGGIVGASLFTKYISNITCGIQDGELCLLCARPGQGKTEAAIQSVVENARRGLRVHMHSLEMKDYQIVRRMIRYVAKIPVRNMRDLRVLSREERRRVVLAREELADLKINIDDTHELNTQEYRSRCVLAAKRWKADLIVLDYAQLLIVRRAKNIIEAAPKQAETIRHIARDYCRTLALAQLRRTPPNDLNRFPDMEDILGSSAFEQAAQIILMMHRSRKDKKYTGEDFCFLTKMRELQTIQPLGIKAEPWGGFTDRFDGER
jgi:replicative DNA helicase